MASTAALARSSARWARGRVLVGVSGYNYATWRGPFYPPGLPARRFLEHASHCFPSIEPPWLTVVTPVTTTPTNLLNLLKCHRASGIAYGGFCQLRLKELKFIDNRKGVCFAYPLSVVAIIP